MSYEDLSDPLRNNFVKWVHSADKEVNITRFGKFILDVPPHLLIDLFKEQPQIVCSLSADILEHSVKAFNNFLTNF